MNINELLKKCLFLNGEFNRYDIPLRVRAARTWFTDGKIDDLWWRMQYAKLFYWTGADGKPYYEVVGKIVDQRVRLMNIVDLVRFETKVDPIKITADCGLVDGAHRLSAYMAFGKNEIPILIVPPEQIPETAIIYYPPEWKKMLMNLYTEREWCTVINLATQMAIDVKEGKWK